MNKSNEMLKKAVGYVQERVLDLIPFPISSSLVLIYELASAKLDAAQVDAAKKWIDRSHNNELVIGPRELKPSELYNSIVRKLKENEVKIYASDGLEGRFPSRYIDSNNRLIIMDQNVGNQFLTKENPQDRTAYRTKIMSDALIVSVYEDGQWEMIELNTQHSMGDLSIPVCKENADPIDTFHYERQVMSRLLPTLIISEHQENNANSTSFESWSDGVIALRDAISVDFETTLRA